MQKGFGEVPPPHFLVDEPADDGDQHVDDVHQQEPQRVDQSNLTSGTVSS